MPGSSRESTASRTRIGRVSGDGLREQRVAFIHDLADWKLFITLTFSWDVSHHGAHDAVKAFLREIAAKHEHRHLIVAWGGGRQFKERLHYHILAAPFDGGDFRSDPRVLERLWLAGDGEVKPVRDRMGSAVYLFEQEFWNVAVVCDRTKPCQRKHGCRLGSRYPSMEESFTT